MCLCVYIATVLSAVWNPLGRESLLPQAAILFCFSRLRTIECLELAVSDSVRFGLSYFNSQVSK